MNFSKQFSGLRKRANINQEYIAKLMNVSQRTISSWESGSRLPSIEKLCAIADYFQVSTDYLLGRTDIPTAPSAGPSYEHQPIPTTMEELIALIQQVINDTIISKFTQ